MGKALSHLAPPRKRGGKNAVRSEGLSSFCNDCGDGNIRFNGSLTREFLKYESFEDFEDAKIKLDKYRDFYNTKRPHYALNLDTPAKHYHPSERAYTPDISEWEYSDEYKLRKVKESGYVTIRNQGYYLSEAFGGKTIAVKESNKGQHLINLYFRQFRIGQIDIEKRVFTLKKAYLIENDPRFAEAKHKK